MGKLPQKILIVDSDRTVAGPILEPLEKMKVEVFSASDLQTAMYRFNKQFFRVIFIELKFPELDAISLIQKWRSHKIKEKRTAGFAITTGSPLTNEQLSLVNEMGKILIIQKPLSIGPLISQIQKAFRNHTKQELANKIKLEILERLEKDGDFKVAIKQTQEFQEALDDEYYRLILDLYQKADNYQDGLEFLARVPQDRIEPLQRLNLMGTFLMTKSVYQIIKNNLAVLSVNQKQNLA